MNLGVGLVFVTLLRCGELWGRGQSPLRLLRRPPTAPHPPRLFWMYMVAPGVCGSIIVSTTIVLIDQLGCVWLCVWACIVRVAVRVPVPVRVRVPVPVRV